MICNELASGLSLGEICETFGIHRGTVHDWLLKDSVFADKYARARDSQADVYAERILQVAEHTQEGVRIEESDDGTKVIREDMLGHRRLLVDALKWRASKLAPKKYGDKLDVDANVALTVEIVRFGENTTPE